jgi:tryptophan-rich sensory protein
MQRQRSPHLNPLPLARGEAELEESLDKSTGSVNAGYGRAHFGSGDEMWKHLVTVSLANQNFTRAIVSCFSMRVIIISLAICAAAAVLEAILAGQGARAYLARLRQPRFFPPFPVWIVIGVCYYLMCFFLLGSLLATTAQSAWHSVAFALLLLLMLANAFWNFLFFRLRNLRYSFLAFFPYGFLVVILAGVLIRSDVAQGWLVFLYLGYVSCAAWWSYHVWRLNESASQ